MTSATPPATLPPVNHGPRVVAAGKFLQLADGTPHFVRGVSYGPFKPNSRGEPFPEDDRLAADLLHIAALGFNTVRLYEPPTAVVLREVEALGLRLIVGIPWSEHVDFLASRSLRREIEAQVAAISARLGNHACITAFLVGNEIEKTLVRWMKPQRVRAFIEKLILIARRNAPQTLISYATYPSTGYLVPRNADFIAVNVYLESAAAFSACLAQWQNLAGNQPLIITEFGLDVAAHGPERQVEVMRWQHNCLLGGGCAGGVWFAYTDEWHRGGKEITDWQFGLVDRERKERPACALQRELSLTWQPPATPPRISVVVCTRNGAATLGPCLDSLVALRYPDFEILLIDDGSRPQIAEIAKGYPQVRYQFQEHAGLSAARNHGARIATGSIIAYTDDDCIAHPDWLLHLSHAFADDTVAAAGGPNIPPPPRNRIEHVVAAAPGAPAHVLLNDTEAEHLPGCNLAIRKDALDLIGGFRVEFKTAGDDVDVCWRLRETGRRLLFVPGAMVWHHRRFTIRAYLTQQFGYGCAEALLMKEHPERFGFLGGARWRGGIYGDQHPADHPVEGSIFHGPLGLGAFQVIYSSSSFRWWEWFTGLLWLALLLLALICQQPWLALGLLGFACGSAWQVSARNAASASIRGVPDRLLLWWLSFLQPVVREWARLRGMLKLGARPSRHPMLPDIMPPTRPHKITLSLGTLCFWSETGITRDAWLQELRKVLRSAHIIFREDDGWRWFDIEAWPWSEISRAFLSVTEFHADGRCLTRVKLLLRIRRSLGWNLLLWLIVTAILMAAGLHMLLVLGLVAVVAIVLLVPLGAWIIRREMCKLARSAATSAGLIEMR
ncbi:MAG: glycosyltransferase [Prosthecobacter sp.]|uniref:glycosyltransferase n=1 Tax=Prosthecobacter sp. TaxID=1965333 RepID=UPI0025EFF02D|nr:glycosyltransferase [Prosthecobacter sp.]MCF7787927.1 glycosyltransferase [Prosthecobacter sp.]